MTRPTVFYIQLNNPPPQNVYYPGYRVEGFVYLQLNGPLTARGLNLHFSAGEQTDWTIRVRSDQYGYSGPGNIHNPQLNGIIRFGDILFDGLNHHGHHHGHHHGRHNGHHGHHHGHHGEHRRVTYVTKRITQSLNYMDFRMPLLVPSIGASEVTLPPGNSQFFFSFNLPNYQLPPSIYNLEHGRVVYVLRAYLDLAWRPDFETHHNLQVRPFPSYPSNFYLSPCKLTGDHTFGCCFKSGVLNYTHELNKNVFTCGERIRISGVLNNISSVKILGLTAHISMSITYMANGMTKVDQKSLYSESHPPTVEAYAMELQTPFDMIPTTFNTCQLIKVSYTLVITIKTKGCRSNIVKSFPIIVLPPDPNTSMAQTTQVDSPILNEIPIGQQIPVDYSVHRAEKAAEVDNLPRYEEVVNMDFRE